MLSIRRSEPEDLPTLYAVYHDPTYKEFFRRIPKNWRLADVARIEELLNCHLYSFVSDGVLFGFAVVSDLDAYGSSVHTGFLLLKEYQDKVSPPTGHKYCFEAAKLLLNQLFLHTNLHKASMRFLAHRADIVQSLTLGGFHLEAEYKESIFFDGKRQDEIEMAILRPKYEEIYLWHS